ncbi:DUF7521 family protein [Natronobeatus ordinarius]|uniref:DUF7521 family protein n=1 Tax=Natronobeatus ordinarius TaxID=2963433 RepID=UPI0020CFE52E|nr:hypothetical protein [Natronobeatus ordinarius]
MTPLVLSPQLQGMIAFALTIVSTILGLAIGYLALRGYLQSRKRPMLFIAVGFFLVFWTPVLLLAGPLFVTVFGEFLYGILGEVSRVLGLLCILYGLWTPVDRTE